MAAITLAVGLVIIYESLLKSLDAYQVFETRSQAQLVADEIVTGIEGQIRSPRRTQVAVRQQGSTSAGGSMFAWQAQVMPAPAAAELYQVLVTVSWQEAGRSPQVQRATYLAVALLPEKGT